MTRRQQLAQLNARIEHLGREVMHGNLTALPLMNRLIAEADALESDALESQAS